MHARMCEAIAGWHSLGVRLLGATALHCPDSPSSGHHPEKNGMHPLRPPANSLTTSHRTGNRTGSSTFASATRRFRPLTAPAAVPDFAEYDGVAPPK